jgi:hypothetical protein
MAIGQASLTSGNSATDSNSYASASISPTSNNLILLAVWGEAVTENNNGYPSSVSGNGLTWVKINDAFGDTFSDCSVWRALGASPSSGAVTMTFANDQTGILWQLSEFSNVDTSGTNGSGAIVQTARTQGGSAAAMSVTLAAFGSANNATFGAFGAYHAGGDDYTHTPGSGFTEIYDDQLNPDDWKDTLMTQWRADNDTTVDATLSSAPDAYGAIAIEIKEAVAGGATGKSNPLSGPLGGCLSGPIG